MNERNEVGMQAEFWNDAGGRMWVENIERTHALLKPLGDALLERVAPQPGEAVLDVGCGGGLNSIELARRVGETGRVVAVDVSEIILDYARAQENLPANLEFVRADAATEIFRAAGFDLLFSRFGVMFFEDPIAAFRNMRANLRGGGRLVFQCWQVRERNPWLSIPMQAAFEILTPPDEMMDPRAPGPFSFADRDWVEEILQSAGFAEVQVEDLVLEMSMGSLEEAVAYSTRFGPAVEAFKAASDADRAAAEQAIRSAFQPLVRDGVVVGTASTWIVTANNPGE